MYESYPILLFCSGINIRTVVNSFITLGLLDLTLLVVGPSGYSCSLLTSSHSRCSLILASGLQWGLEYSRYCSGSGWEIGQHIPDSNHGHRADSNGLEKSRTRA